MKKPREPGNRARPVPRGSGARSTRRQGCSVRRSLPDRVPDEVRGRARDRLFEALQAVHLRGETHLTVRELRSALSYILFGTRYCEDYHRESSGEAEPSYWDRAFDPESQRRQGEVLRELVQMDPGARSPSQDRSPLDPGGAWVRQMSATLGSWHPFGAERTSNGPTKRIRETARGEEPKKCLGLARGMKPGPLPGAAAARRRRSKSAVPRLVPGHRENRRSAGDGLGSCGRCTAPHNPAGRPPRRRSGLRSRSTGFDSRRSVLVSPPTMASRTATVPTGSFTGRRC